MAKGVKFDVDAIEEALVLYRTAVDGQPQDPRAAPSSGSREAPVADPLTLLDKDAAELQLEGPSPPLPPPAAPPEVAPSVETCEAPP